MNTLTSAKRRLGVLNSRTNLNHLLLAELIAIAECLFIRVICHFKLTDCITRKTDHSASKSSLKIFKYMKVKYFKNF